MVTNLEVFNPIYNIKIENNKFKYYDSKEKHEVIDLHRSILLEEYEKDAPIGLGEEINEELKQFIFRKLKIIKYNNINVIKHSLKLIAEKVFSP